MRDQPPEVIDGASVKLFVKLGLCSRVEAIDHG